MSLELPPAHPKQHELINAFDIHNCRFVVGACGTKFGKTWGCSTAVIRNAWDNKDSLNWWVAPTFSQSKIAYNTIKKLLPRGFYHEYKADLRITILEPDGEERSSIEFKSGDNPDSLRGFGVHFAVMDEAARMPYESFVSVQTTLTQTQGRGIFISTPKGRGWFYDVYQRGEILRPENPEWFSMRMPTWLNPHVPLKSIDDLKNLLPEDTFRQEVAAQFLLDSAGVFRRIKDCIKGVLEEPAGRSYGVGEKPLPGHTYVMGVDLARLRDFSVLTVMDRERRHVVYFERFNKIEWAVQYQRIVEVARKYSATVWMDSRGIGDPIVETIKGSGVRVEPYKIGGSAAKQQLIEKLRVNIENVRISFPVLPILIRELENYEYEISETGVVKYSAPDGFHDDCVVSLALANWGADQAPFFYRYRNIRGV